MTAVQIRATDADRVQATDKFGHYMSAGCLSLEEFEERVEKASLAQTRDELAALFADLPPYKELPPAPPTYRKFSIKHDLLLDFVFLMAAWWTIPLLVCGIMSIGVDTGSVIALLVGDFLAWMIMGIRGTYLWCEHRFTTPSKSETRV